MIPIGNITLPTGLEGRLAYEVYLTDPIEYCRVIDFALRELEPYAVKVASTVLRGLGRGDPPWLPDGGEGWRDGALSDRRWRLEVEWLVAWCWLTETGCRMPDSGYVIRDSRYGIRDSRFEIWDTGYGIRDLGCEMLDARC